MQVQFEGGKKKSRVGSINIATLLYLYAHGTSNSFSTNVKSVRDHENLS